ncbi:MAG: magnesium/cobalt transporter CorA [Planctomycetes bacterium]|nr:magnesium/cobalt transporter CorA [Planctomycetota bacterium]
MLTGIYRSASTGARVFTEAKEVGQCLARREGMLWLDLEAPSPEEVALLENDFHFHPLLVQECLRLTDRPKVDFSAECVYLIVHAPHIDKKERRVTTLEIDVFLGPGYLLTYHPYPVESITLLRERCKPGGGGDRLLARGPDFLLYHFAEAVVDHFFTVVDDVELRMDDLEKEVFSRATERSFRKILHLKRDLSHLRRILGPQREVFSLLAREDTPFVSAEAQRHLRNVYDHFTIIHDVAETDRDMVAGLRDTYLSYVSNRLAQTMKVLTVITTCLMPASILAGAWGMNFDHIPLKEWPYAFEAFFLSCTLLAGGMLGLFHWRRWI